jgi:hypothetical protein
LKVNKTQISSGTLIPLEFGANFVFWQSARDLAQSKTLRVFQEINVARATSWIAVVRHREGRHPARR